MGVGGWGLGVGGWGMGFTDFQVVNYLIFREKDPTRFLDLFSRPYLDCLYFRRWKPLHKCKLSSRVLNGCHPL
ncbi:MAG: hypothetical protein EWV57_20675 [Microcystis aeruginosa Ma_QC_Ch_20071001_S25D]|uniref:Uncharacterized protein n=1 Tax=Microcystis aeruginosa Ma_QC_Ch_20071001_S25D TaxID=2486250 RepID=A0A552FF43_MICAE|nr:MAG: hypothetical protein EWV57_20675 [Microcystis aeruginosa Ma_QC_Ch_20071001_S25D]